ncbi:MAG: VWA domain-containing protein [Pirellulaceae bacterium]|nr:VWA domain-containing protein [Pirellulaceae bacterium]
MNHMPRGLRSFAWHTTQRTRRVVSRPVSRRGSAAMLITVMMFVFVVTAAITVDYAYMQLVRTELRAATDAAAKAGAEALSRTQDTFTAKNEAVRYASQNKVGGRAFRLSTDDVVVGRVRMNGAGRWQFRENEEPYNAVKVNARTGEGASQPAVPLYFGRALGKAGFAPSYQATAGQQEVEVCLCIDRSGSMNFDMSGTEYSFPPDNPRLSPFTAWGVEWRNMLSPPHPVHSRWAALKRAIDVFLIESSSINAQPRTSVVTWGSDYTMPLAPRTVYPASSTDLGLPSRETHRWQTNADQIRGLMQARNDSVIMGSTNLSSGLDRAVQVLNGPNNNRFANKVIILLTDGVWNVGRDPVLAAYDARAQGMIVHCISMLTQNQPTLQTVATTCGGRYYGTRNEEELRNAFIEIARSLPVVLTE